jgi:photosystem II stability/assembly factor-like uncharacterized protein
LALRLNSISAVDANTCWTVGNDSRDPQNAYILKTSGASVNWSVQFSTTDIIFSGVSAVDANTCWAIGHRAVAGGYERHIYRTTNGGASWQEINLGTSPYALSSVSAVDANTCWVASTGVLNFTDKKYTGALLKTADGGVTWTDQGPNNRAYLCVSAVDRQVAWYSAFCEGESAEQSSCFRTLDGGATWNSGYVPYFMLGGFQGMDAVSASTAWTASFKAPNSGAIYKSTNGSTDWTVQAEFPPANSVYRFMTAVSAVDTKNAWAVGINYTPGAAGSCEIYHTSNGGWTQAAPQISSITPSSGALGGVVNITNLAGSNFQSGATVWLERSGTIINATDVVVTPTKITCKFNLSGVPVGAYDVVVRNPDGTDGRLSKGFNVNAPNPCGLGGGLSLLLFGAIMGLVSLAGSRTILRRG